MASKYEALRLKDEEMASNKATRALICLCIDASFSMNGERITTVNQEIDKFLKNMYNNKTARDAVEICIVSFSDTVELLCNFGPIQNAMEANNTIKAMGTRTSLGAGVECALGALDKEIANLEAGGNRYYKPWLIIISDGEATDQMHCEKICKDVIERQCKGKLKVKCLSMGDVKDTETLRKFSLEGIVEQINCIQAMEFFAMLSRSVSAASQSSIQFGEF